jgi:hypothetical protein
MVLGPHSTSIVVGVWYGPFVGAHALARGQVRTPWVGRGGARTLGSDESGPAPLGSYVMGPMPLGLDEVELVPLGSVKAEPALWASDEAVVMPLNRPSELIVDDHLFPFFGYLNIGTR